MKHFKMSRIIFIILLSLFIAVPTFTAIVPDDEYVIPERISNNRFFLESVRLNRLAIETFEFGDYNASTGFAEEALRFAQLSNEFVSAQLILEAERLLGWARVNNFATRHESEYNESRAFYDRGVAEHSFQNWDSSISSAISSIEIIWRYAPDAPPSPRHDGLLPLPSQYTVRTWATERDSLWTIAGYSWVYNDSWQWRRLYDANRSRMPEPNNPNLIEPGFILEIPSIRGEARQGMWDPNRTYQPLP